ncbi:glycosyltransferase family 25 protein [Corynebacterium qintianiae]|uniref:Glycosyltransferase family 25 protein n=1 Tax=Corynebacterium qintianiae TaxID=2709392 RepID=A0A7T0KL60_9CORY|nr:glycosyltransferase family 25 protein [Corynebacterium qintianiae]QPK82778.1 glycosyltransferase family 25 protein [Corynebacterium qintianiae]
MSKWPTEQCRRLIKQIRVRPRIENWEDPEFRSFAASLNQEFEREVVAGFAPDSEQTAAYFEIIRMDWGPEAVKTTGHRLIGSGLDPATVSSAWLTSFQAGGAHTLAAELLEELHFKFRTNEIVALRYGQSLAAVGRRNALSTLAEESALIYEYGEWGKTQWASLLLDAMLPDNAMVFIQYMQKNESLRASLSWRAQGLSVKPEPFPYETLLINLNREPRKWRISEMLLKLGGFQPTRIEAIDARNVPYFALKKVAANQEVMESQGISAIATALSHLKCWEKACNLERPTLILEDDAVPFVTWNHIASEEFEPGAWDLLFINERMSLCSSLDTENQAVDPWHVLSNRRGNVNGVGTDAYMVSREGARKLLELFDRDGIYGHIDWQLGAYAVDKIVDPDKSNPLHEALTHRLAALGDSNGLKVACMDIPMFKAVDHGVSNTVDISREMRE